MRFPVHFPLLSLVSLLLLLLSSPCVNAQTHSPSVATIAPSPAPGTYSICYVCGDPGQRITDPEHVLLLNPIYTCLSVENMGLNGQFSNDTCSVAQQFAQACGCADTLAPSPPTEAPVAPPTFAPHLPVTPNPSKRPVATLKPTARPVTLPPTRRPTLTPTATTSTLAPSPAPGTYPVCYVCGDPGQRVTEPDVELILPSSITITCNNLENRGLNGQIRNEFCTAVVLFVLPCGCADTLAPSPPTEAPVAPPTFAPHLPVTPNPSRRPVTTLKPTARPVTLSPTKRPTVVPVQPTSAPVVPSVKPTATPTVAPQPIQPPTTPPPTKQSTIAPILPTSAPVVSTPKPAIAPQPVQIPTSAAPVAKPTLAPVAVKPSLAPVARGTSSPTLLFGRMKGRPISGGGGMGKVASKRNRGGAGF